MSCSEQIVLFQRTKPVLGAHRAGLTNIIHCRPGTLVAELMPSGLKCRCYSVLSQIFGIHYITIPRPQGERGHDINVPISGLDQIVEKYGWLLMEVHVVLR